ncbi:MAG TPA: S1 family peptidase [Mycobacteriales bacterium]|nr:S1 family peptidase [Mycobacteriales bacterium]
MSGTRRTLGRRTAIAAAAVAAVTATALATPSALAAPAGGPATTAAGVSARQVNAARPVSVDTTAKWLAGRTGMSLAAATAQVRAQSRLVGVADRLTRQLGSASGGAYLDGSGRLVVNVTTRSAVATVTSAGATARMVRRSTAQLTAVSADLHRQPRVVGSYWSIDPATDRVTLGIPKGAAAGATRGLLAAAARHGDAVRVVRDVAPVHTDVSTVIGGLPIYHAATGARCSAGFTVRAGSVFHVLDAGHCTILGGLWLNFDGTPIGNSTAAAFPGVDTGLIGIQSGQISLTRGVYLYNTGGVQPITSAGAAFPGLPACKSGSTTGVTCGTVLAVNACVVYVEGPVCGLDQTNIAAGPGDSGGSYFTGTVGLGTVSGGGGGITFFQPLIPALARWGVALA